MKPKQDEEREADPDGRSDLKEDAAAVVVENREGGIGEADDSFVRDADGAAVGKDKGEAFDHHHRGKRGDERVDFEFGDDDTVDEADDGPESEGCADGERAGCRCRAESMRRERRRRG
ncbi:MAG: hypothetical protein QM760_02465 [Nibricoccus sp.]